MPMPGADALQIPQPGASGAGRVRAVVGSAMQTTLAPSGSSYLKDSGPNSLCSTVNRTNQARAHQSQHQPPPVVGQSANSLLGPAGAPVRQQSMDLVQTIQLTQSELQERMSRQQLQQMQEKEQELQLTKVSLEEKDKELAKRDKEIMEKEGQITDLRAIVRVQRALQNAARCHPAAKLRRPWREMWAATLLASARLRREQLLRHHPLYGRQLSQDDWPALSQQVLAARALPLGHRAIACLIEGEEDVTAKESAFWDAGADVFKLTFRTRRQDALFFPNSLLAEGRNFLFAAAAVWEHRLGYRYTYYTFLDADASVDSWPQSWQHFEDFLWTWEPAVGLPGLYDYSQILDEYLDTDPSEVRSVLNFDHTVVAVHSDASVWLLPYVTDLDAHCQWVSQWRFSSLANALFPQHVLLTHKVLVKNPHHATYSKSRCLELMRRVTLELREAVAPEARSCFVEPSNQALLLEGAPKLTAYLPWSHPLRRAQAEPWRRNYSAPDFARRMRSCIHEPVVQAVEQAQKSEASEEESYSWCRGCSLAVAYAVLQVIISSRPFDFTGWVKLANLAAKGRGDRGEVELSLRRGCKHQQAAIDLRNGSSVTWGPPAACEREQQ
ncbi:unnamed protein product [Effrenium voratum]|nr:unnamed protein product [Effrenium voratum]